MKFNLDLDNITYIKIVYKDIDEKTRCAKGVIKHLGEHEIFACTKIDEDIVLPHNPQDVITSFVCENGLYRTSTQLKHTEKREEYTFFILQTPEGIEYQQNREFFRVKKDNKVILRYDNKVLTCEMHDISANGIRLVLPEHIGEPENVIIDMMFDTRDIKTHAQFVRTDDEDGILKFSFRFVDMPESDQDFISQICIQTQLEQKRNSVR